MPSALEIAVEEMQEEVDSFQQGTAAQPKDGSTEWYLLRAMTLGLAYLKRLNQLGVGNDPRACERVYLRSSAHFKAAEVPPEPDVVH